jgi:chloramphenicol O-acetyltransferase
MRSRVLKREFQVLNLANISDAHTFRQDLFWQVSDFGEMKSAVAYNKMSAVYITANVMFIYFTTVPTRYSSSR